MYELLKVEENQERIYGVTMMYPTQTQIDERMKAIDHNTQTLTNERNEIDYEIQKLGLEKQILHSLMKIYSIEAKSCR